MVPLNEMVSENLLVPRLPIIASLFFFCTYNDGVLCSVVVL